MNTETNGEHKISNNAFGDVCTPKSGVFPLVY